MKRGSLIRRVPDVAFVALLGAGLWLGGGEALAGLPRFIEAATPGMAAQAKPETGPHGIARFALPEGFAASQYAPQVLYPVPASGWPGWLEQAARLARLTPPPPLRDVPVVGAAHPVIAICIDDLGEDIAGTDKAMALPKAVALSFLPYPDTTAFLAIAAAKRGHMILAHVPMQAISARDPGPMALKPGMTNDEITRRLGWNLDRVPGIAGINNHEGSRFTADAASLAPVMKLLKARGLFFLDSRTSGASLGEMAARAAGVQTIGRDIFLDDDQSEAAVKAQLEALAHEARRTGIAIAIGHPHDVTLRLLAAWLAQDHGVMLVPLDEAMRLKVSRATAVAAR
ncbi:MAG: uncharacterized protein JWP16_1106 [Alphaproteobacteria bacterium]|nr:uncharacterized protein [Alphaproteobacteria bacterium]